MVSSLVSLTYSLTVTLVEVSHGKAGRAETLLRPMK